jgi:hypothetical protein
MRDEREVAILDALVDYHVAVVGIADAIIERIPLAVMSRLVGHPYRWNSIVDKTKPAVIAKVGVEYDESAWEDAKQRAWTLLAEHNGFAWPKKGTP